MVRWVPGCSRSGDIPCRQAEDKSSLSNLPSLLSIPHAFPKHTPQHLAATPRFGPVSPVPPLPKKWSKATPPVEKNWPQADDKTEKMRLPEKRPVQDVRHPLKYGHDSCIISAHTTREEHWLDLSNRPTQLKKTCVISGGERGVVLKNVVN